MTTFINRLFRVDLKGHQRFTEDKLRTFMYVSGPVLMSERNRLLQNHVVIARRLNPDYDAVYMTRGCAAYVIAKVLFGLRDAGWAFTRLVCKWGFLDTPAYQCITWSNFTFLFWRTLRKRAEQYKRELELITDIPLDTKSVRTRFGLPE